jgi:hypothetical protein
MKQQCLCVLSGGVLIAAIMFAASLVKADDEKDVVAPIESVPEGQTYGRWAAQWQEWALGVPAAENPVLDTTGQNCGQRQVDRVWFLAGTFGSDPVVRACNIPADKALFFPLIDNAYFAFLNDPPEQRTEEYVRSRQNAPSRPRFRRRSMEER